MYGGRTRAADAVVTGDSGSIRPCWTPLLAQKAREDLSPAGRAENRAARRPQWATQASSPRGLRGSGGRLRVARPKLAGSTLRNCAQCSVHAAGDDHEYGSSEQRLARQLFRRRSRAGAGRRTRRLVLDDPGGCWRACSSPRGAPPGAARCSPRQGAADAAACSSTSASSPAPARAASARATPAPDRPSCAPKSDQGRPASLSRRRS